MPIPYLLLLSFLLAIGPRATAAIVVPDAPPAATNAEAEVREAVREYRESLENMSAKERRQLKREKRRAVREALRDHRKAQGTVSYGILIILAILLPPLSMYLYEGDFTDRFWLSLLLTVLGYLPGIVYTLYVLLSEN